MEEVLIEALERSHEVDSVSLAAAKGMDHLELVDGAVKSLAARKAVAFDTIEHRRFLLTGEGEDYAAHGSPEFRVWSAVKANPAISKDRLEEKLGGNAILVKLGLGNAMRRKCVQLNKQTKEYSVPSEASDFFDETAAILKEIKAAAEAPGVADATIAELKKRKLVVAKPHKSYKIRRGEKFSEARMEQATELTMDMVRSGRWKEVLFKEYNFAAGGRDQEAGALHPLLKVREQVRNVFFQMGFEEMATNQYVESSFWNFDALFQPQQHPARDAHDTFFLSSPAAASVPDREYLTRVKEVHERGGYGSLGYRYSWSEEEARKNILRTHTTAVSSRMLYLLAGKDEFEPAKYFSIDRVFRNETLDATHLCEFHQIEGVVADRNLSLGHLKGVIHQFFKRLMGSSKLRFKPAYNPYTEPSMEIFSYHEGLGEWVEVGNSGVFRPEMLQPMGLPADVSVIAWGLSLERPTMIKYGIDNIRDLFGHKVSLKQVQSNPICRIGY